MRMGAAATLVAAGFSLAACAGGGTPAGTIAPPLQRSAQRQGAAQPACPQVAGQPTCLALIDRKGEINATVAGWGPSDFQTRYNLPSSTKGSGQIVAVVNPYDNPNVASDLAAYRAEFNLAAWQLYEIQSGWSDEQLSGGEYQLGLYCRRGSRDGCGGLPEVHDLPDRSELGLRHRSSNSRSRSRDTRCTHREQRLDLLRALASIAPTSTPRASSTSERPALRAMAKPANRRHLQASYRSAVRCSKRAARPTTNPSGSKLEPVVRPSLSLRGSTIRTAPLARLTTYRPSL